MDDDTSQYSGNVFFDDELNTTVISLKGIASEVRIAPELGSNLFQFTLQGKEIIYCDTALLKDRDWTGCFVLWPYPNRIRNKEYEFEGQKVSLKDIKRKKGNYPLIHGLVDDKVWKYEKPVVTPHNVSVKTSFEISEDNQLFRFFPFKSSLTLHYVLTEEGIKIEYTAENKSNKNMPFGFALHPYFSTLSGLDKTRVVLPADKYMIADKDLLPTGELKDVTGSEFDLRTPTPIKALSLDHVFTSLLADQHARIEYPEQKMILHLDSSLDFTHLVIYTMEKDSGFICLENQTGSTDMINLHSKGIQAAHLLILEPGQTHTGFIQYRIEHT